jgi:serine/threonine-protein kinase HipA
MQIARQIYKIKTASCGLIFFNDGSPAYITRRFDYKPDGSKYQVEDFATLLGKSPEKEGDNYKYNASYLDIADLIAHHAPAATVELINFFRLVLFNYLFANGDAHLKNVALMESDQGDYLLAPAYDLMCTALHINDSSFALQNGLYDGDRAEPPYLNYGAYTRGSFLLFANRINVQPALANAIIDESMLAVNRAFDLIDRCFLSAESKSKYKEIVGDRHRYLLL